MTQATAGRHAPERWARELLRSAAIIASAFVVFGVVLVVSGNDPIRAYSDAAAYTFGNIYGFTELLIRMVPLMLTAVAVALPSRLGLINVGGEGQLIMGAWMTTWAALSFSSLPAPLLIPVVALAGFAGGGLWALVPGVLRARGLVNETISTLLLNYVAPMVVGYSIFGPWRSPESASYPQSHAFVDAARLPTFGGTRIHLGILFAAAAIVLFWFVVNRTRWGLEIRAIGGNPEAAKRLGLPLTRYIIVVMLVAGGLAGLAGMVEVSAIHGRLRQAISPGYGFTGFLISWLAAGSSTGIVLMAFVFAVLTSVGDILQITQGVPYAVVNVLTALILFTVLARPGGLQK